MIEPTDEMLDAFVQHMSGPLPVRERPARIRGALAAVLAIVERDNYVSRRPTPEEAASWPQPKPRLRACVENWPECNTGDYDPRCCRWPKSCSATAYDPRHVTDEDLEPVADTTKGSPR